MKFCTLFSLPLLAVMFKLQQLKCVDMDILHRLCDRFRQLDIDRTGVLKVGVHVPSAQQVKDMQEEIKDTKKTIVDAWKEKQEREGLLD